GSTLAILSSAWVLRAASAMIRLQLVIANLPAPTPALPALPGQAPVWPACHPACHIVMAQEGGYRWLARDADRTHDQGGSMTGRARYEPQGVIPACLLPFFEDLTIDEASFRHHLSDVAAVSGLSAVTLNAHASEVASCTFDEQRRVLAIAVDEIGARLPIVNGIYAEGSLEAARLARMAQEGGASALLVFPPGPFTLGQRSEMAIAHFRRIADASDL